LVITGLIVAWTGLVSTTGCHDAAAPRGVAQTSGADPCAAQPLEAFDASLDGASSEPVATFSGEVTAIDPADAFGRILVRIGVSSGTEQRLWVRNSGRLLPLQVGGSYSFHLEHVGGSPPASALVVRDAGGSDLGGSGYTPSSDDRVTRPGWYALERSQLPFADGSNVGVVAGAHWQDVPDTAAVAGVADERGTFNGFGGLDSQLRFTHQWRSELQLVGSGSYIDSVNTPTARTSFSDWMGVARLFYRDKARSLELGARHVGEKFRDELGYQDYAGVSYRHMGAFWDLFPKGSALQRTAPIVDALVVHDHTGRLELADLQASQDFEFRRSAFVNAGYQHVDEHWLNHTYPQDRAHVFAQWTAWRPLTMDFDALLGDGILFGETDATSALAWQEVYVLNATVRPTSWVTAAGNVTRYRLATAYDGDDHVAQWLVGVNLTAQFTQRLSLRVYPQYDSNAEHLDANGLLSYVIHPGTVFYAGVNSGWNRDLADREPRTTSRQAFAKASWRFFL